MPIEPLSPRRLDNGNLLVPVRLEGPQGELGDAMEEIDPSHPDWSEWMAEVTQDERRQWAAGTLSLVRPDLPQWFVLIDPGTGEELLGRLNRDEAFYDPDNAVVFIDKHGSLPLRLAVRSQEGDVLHLYPNWRVRVVAVDPPPAEE